MHLPELTSALPMCGATNYSLLSYNYTDNTLKINHSLTKNKSLRYIRYCQSARVVNCVVVNFLLLHDSHRN